MRRIAVTRRVVLPLVALLVAIACAPHAAQAAGEPAGSPSCDSIAARFADAARCHGGKVAIDDLHRQVTYRELAEWAVRVGSAVAQCVPPNEPVGIFVPHDVHLAPAVLGVLSAGRGVASLDAENPIERNRLIARHAGARAVLSVAALAPQARELFGPEARIIDIDALPPANDDPCTVDPDHLAWIIYTSGSTGTPKGVYQNHRGLAQDVAESIDGVGLTSADRQTWFYSLAVIAGLRSMLACLTTGASMTILPPRLLGAERIAQEMLRLRLTMFRGSATLFRRVADALPPEKKFDDVRLVTLGGDYIHWSDLDLCRRVCAPGVRFVAHLGSTEASTCWTQWYVDERERDGGSRLPVGYPLPGRDVRLIREDGEAAPDGEIGEFVVAGAGIALGYWREPELTAKVFLPDPRNLQARMLHTGDLGRRRPSGVYEFHGRKDHQIKLRGYRIEPGEVEGALRSCSGVRDAAIVVRRDGHGIPTALAGYVQLETGVKGLLPRHLKVMLEQRLPAQMVPADIYVLDALPWLPNFKIDGKRLAEIDAARAQKEERGEQNVVTDRVARIFKTVLKIDRATADDSLASLGGDSLQAVETVLKLEREFAVPIPPEVFRASRSIGDLAAWIAPRLPPASRPGKRA
jgi:amino acid adenylation domain-containing protein